MSREGFLPIIELMRRIPAWALCLALLACLSVYAQGAQDDAASVFAPYPTRVRVGTNEDSIVLSWIDSPDVQGDCVIYRAAEPINEDSFASAVKAGTVPYGSQRFVDREAGPGEWYYAVLSMDESGIAYEVFLPFKNVTAVGLSSPSSERVASASADSADSTSANADEAPQAFADVSGIGAKTDSDAIVVRYQVSPIGHRLVVYRSPEPLLNSLSILSASIVSIVDDTMVEVRDYPVPGIDYYYAVIDEARLRAGGILIEQGRNATSVGVRVPAGAYRIGLPEVSPLSRSLPLPYRVIESSIGSGERLGTAISIPEPSSISPAAEKAIARILDLVPREQIRRPDILILEKDAQTPASGEDYTLAVIVKDSVQKANWSGAISQIEKFLSIRRSQAVESRARFYLGQAYASNGDYREALFSFLMAQDGLYRETRDWISYCLEALDSGS